jgi:uncharacterized membrane protein
LEAQTKKILLIALACCTVIGAVLRFVDLDKKEFWHDECETTLVLSGLSESQLWSTLNKGPITAGSLIRFQKIGPDSTPEKMLSVLEKDEPGHTPLFYLLEYLVGALCGCSPFSMRFLSALFGVLQLPVIYLLAREIWESDEMAWLSTALASLSPTLIYFSQEARDYSLELLMLFLSSLCLLRALRLKTTKSWILYSVSLAVGFYSSLFMFVVAVGHFIYINLTSKLQFRERLIPFAFSLTTTAILFSPWLALMEKNQDNFNQAHAWLNKPVPLTALIKVWTAIPSKAIALYGEATSTMDGALLAITIFQIVSLLVAIILSFKNKKILLLLSLGLAWYLVFAMPDVSAGGIRSVPFRHQTPAIASFLLLTPAFLKVLFDSQMKQLRLLGLAFCAILLAVEMQSSIYVVHCSTFPDKSIRQRYLRPVAEMVNTENSPILLEQTGANSCEILALSHLLKPDTKIYTNAYKTAMVVPEDKQVFLFNPSPALEDTLSLAGYSVHEIAGLRYLKRADRNSPQ